VLHWLRFALTVVADNTCCSGLMFPDNKLGAKVSTINEVFNDKTTTTYIFSEFKIGVASLVFDQGYSIP
jgi:hypothetical protein